MRRYGIPGLALAAFLGTAALFPRAAGARNGSEPLNHYALTTLQDTAIGARLMGRFKAKGQPVFLIHSPDLGMRQGDIMRFQDKAVLVDADVWQTLNDEGALARLNVAPMVRVRAKASVPTWETRAGLVSGLREKKAYQLGAELLKILEETFGGIPSQRQMVMVFDGKDLVLMAPDEFLDQLQYSSVRRVPSESRPRFITPAPPAAFAGRPFRWQAWAADPAEPSGSLVYTLSGSLPPGLTWDAATHALQGAPETEGSWRLVARVRNAAGGGDTLGFEMAVRRNAPPALAHPPKPIAVAGKPWSFRAEAVDPDHEGSRVSISPLGMPQGMTVDSDGRVFQWTPPDSLVGRTVELALRLSDPDGGVADGKFAIRVLPVSEMLLSDGFRPALPWDTLKQGKLYIWETASSAMAWALQGITLKEVAGPASTVFLEGTLRLRPAGTEPHVLRFIFDVQGQPMEQIVELPVRPDLPPRFASESGIWRLRSGQQAGYRPVAVDEDGDPVTVIAAPPRDGGPAWDGERLEMESERPGVHTARLVATDLSGNSASQWVAYKIEHADRPTAWFVENRIQGGVSTWTATADFGTGRMGIFTANLDRIGVKGPSGARNWPYLFFGGNLMGRENERRGRRLWVDAGLTLRVPDPKVATGGVYGRLLGEWTFPDQVLGKIEFEMQGHVNQAVLVTDTSNLQFIYGESALEFTDKFGKTIDGIIKEATAKDNMALYTRLEGWSRLGAGFWMGPGIWREDVPNDHRYYQRLGGGIRYQAHLGEAIAANTLRVGWGGGGAGWSAYWTGRLSFFSPF